jgi:hypothetical protein
MGGGCGERRSWMPTATFCAADLFSFSIFAQASYATDEKEKEELAHLVSKEGKVISNFLPR